MRHRRSNKPAEVNPKVRSAQMGSLLLYGTFTLLIFGPIAFGAVEPWSIFIVETGAVILSAVWLAKQWFDGEINILWNPLFLPMAAFGVVEPWSIFIVETCAVILSAVWLAKQWFDGEINILWNTLFLPMAAFGVVIALQFVLRVSVYRHDSIAQAMLYCAYGMLCFLANQNLLRASQARKVALILALFGVTIACLALLQGVAPNGKLYWVRQPRLGGWIYGPYVNHNHYAGLMELLAPVPLI